MIRMECEYCGREYLAERISSKFCSNSCRTMAYRKRKAEYRQLLLVLEKQKVLEESYKKYRAELDERNRMDNIERQEQLRQEEIERKSKLEAERLEKEKRDNEKAHKALEYEQRQAKRKMLEMQNELIAKALAGLAGQIIEKLIQDGNQNDNNEIEDL